MGLMLPAVGSGDSGLGLGCCSVIPPTRAACDGPEDSFLGSPWRIVDDCGGAFTMGAIGGGIFQAIKGFRNSPVVSESTGELTQSPPRGSWPAWGAEIPVQGVAVVN